MTEEAKAFGLAEVAAICGLSTETVRRAARTGELTAFKLAKDYRVSRVELARWWASRGGGSLFEDGAVAKPDEAPAVPAAPAAPKRKAKP